MFNTQHLKIRGQLPGVFSPSTAWILRMESRSSGLVAGIFISRTILLARGGRTYSRVTIARDLEH